MRVVRIVCMLASFVALFAACSQTVTPPGDEPNMGGDDTNGDTQSPPGPDPGIDPDPSAPTGIEKIDEALAAGEIDELDALRYKVFTVFGDDRLPPGFEGAHFEEGTFILDDLFSRYSSLPPEVQDELRPFLLPPDAPGSWYANRLAQGSKISLQMQQPVGTFNELDVTDGSGNSVAVVKWPASDNTLQASAMVVRDAMETVYAKLVELMGRAPLSDEGLGEENNGGDGRYDVYLLKIGGSTYGSTPPNAPDLLQRVFGDARRRPHTIQDVQNIARDHGGYGSAAYEQKLRANIAHEFMHAIQFAFDLSEGRLVPDYRWLADATATWAEHFVFPTENLEHQDAPSFLRSLDDPLETDPDGSLRRYGAYLYFFYQVRQHGEDVVHFTWESAEIADQLTAVDRAVPGGIAENWADFAVANWNEDPADDYELADGLTKGAQDYASAQSPGLSGEQDAVPLTVQGAGLEPLSAQYFHLKMSDPQARSIMFANGLTFKLERGVPSLFAGAAGDETLYATRLSDAERDRLHVMALVKQNGGWSDEAFDLTDVAFAPFCQQVGDESVEEIVIILSNARWEDDERDAVRAKGLETRFFMSNVGCGAWSGTARYSENRSGGGETLASSADFQTLEFIRDTSTLETIMAGGGQVEFGFGGSEVVPTGTLPGVAVSGGAYRIARATANWQHNATYRDGDCIESGSGMLGQDDELGTVFSLSPYLTDTSGNSIPSLYRSFFLEAFFIDTDEQIAGQCVESDGTVRNYESPFGAPLAGGYRNSEFGTLTVAASGDRINQTWTLDDTTFRLDLRSQPIP